MLTLLAAHIIIKHRLFGIGIMPLLWFSPITVIAYNNLIALYNTQGAQEAFAFFVFVVIFSSASTSVQKYLTQGAQWTKK